MRTALVLVAIALMAQAVRAGPEDATAQNLLENWKAGDPATTALAEVIASAFAGGLLWGGRSRRNGCLLPFRQISVGRNHERV